MNDIIGGQIVKRGFLDVGYHFLLFVQQAHLGIDVYKIKHGI